MKIRVFKHNNGCQTIVASMRIDVIIYSNSMAC